MNEGCFGICARRLGKDPDVLHPGIFRRPVVKALFQHPAKNLCWTVCRFCSIALCLLVLATANAGNVFAGTRLVPNNYLSIQEAINASDPGDTIIVGSGVHRLYSGNIVISKKSITLRSENGPQKTIIEGMGDTPVITLDEDSSAVVIEGFTITSVQESRDREVLQGGGIYCAGASSAIISNNVIAGNEAVFGGGIYCGPLSSVTIVNNVISKNSAARCGGGLFVDKSAANITGNTIADNQAANAGGAIFCRQDSARIANNVIWRNKASGYGGAMMCHESYCTIVNDTVIGNAAIYGGGIFFDRGSIRIINTILWQNTDDLYSGWFSPASRPDHSDIGDADFRGVNGNISTDPLFADAEKGDFRLSADSPCIDAGNPDPLYDDSDGSTNDIGAYGGPNSDYIPYQ